MVKNVRNVIDAENRIRNIERIYLKQISSAATDYSLRYDIRYYGSYHRSIVIYSDELLYNDVRNLVEEVSYEDYTI